MKTDKSGGSKLVLLELILSIFMFSIITAVCIQVFSKSHQISENSNELTESINLCSSVAELFRTDADENTWFQTFPMGELGERGFTADFDEEFSPVNSSSAYKLMAEFSQNNGYDTAEISMIRISDFETVYSLKVERLSNE